MGALLLIDGLLPDHGDDVRAAVADRFARVWVARLGQAGEALSGLAGELIGARWRC